MHSFALIAEGIFCDLVNAFSGPSHGVVQEEFTWRITELMRTIAHSSATLSVAASVASGRRRSRHNRHETCPAKLCAFEVYKPASSCGAPTSLVAASAT